MKVALKDLAVGTFFELELQTYKVGPGQRGWQPCELECIPKLGGQFQPKLSKYMSDETEVTVS